MLTQNISHITHPRITTHHCNYPSLSLLLSACKLHPQIVYLIILLPHYYPPFPTTGWVSVTRRVDGCGGSWPSHLDRHGLCVGTYKQSTFSCSLIILLLSCLLALLHPTILLLLSIRTYASHTPSPPLLTLFLTFSLTFANQIRIREKQRIESEEPDETTLRRRRLASPKRDQIVYEPEDIAEIMREYVLPKGRRSDFGGVISYVNTTYCVTHLVSF